MNQNKRKKPVPKKKDKEPITSEQEELKRLTIEEFNEIKKLKVYTNVVRDGKRMERLLTEMCKAINNLTKCC